MLRTLIPLIAMPLPSQWKVFLFRRLLGWRIARTARIGFSYVAALDVVMAERSRIGHLSVFRDVRLRMANDSLIGNWNWVSAATAFREHDPGSKSLAVLSVGAHSAVTSRHYIDASGGVTIGSFTTVAGVRSTILSHQIDLERSIQSAQPVRIGDYCFLSSNICIVPGAEIENEVVVAMGAVVVGHLGAAKFYGGVPAKPIQSKLTSGAYFRRPRGVVGLTPDADPET
jgi:serine acetyltransferase